MKHILATALLLFALNSNAQTSNTSTMDTKSIETNAPTNDSTPKVTGIGGIFFFSDDPAQSRAWYQKNLGIESNEYGATFESRNLDKPEVTEQLQWSLFKTGSKYFAPSKKEFMINYRVQNIEGLVKKLKENGVTMLDEIQNSEYGKFVHLLDADGNKIELWEPS